MIDFIAAYEKGLNAAEIADKNQREIDSVFDELNKQLAAATDGKIKIVRSDKNPFSKTMKDLNKILFIDDIHKEFPSRDQRLFAFNTLNKAVEVLAFWSQDRNGYPCKISYGNKEHYCEDKGALEEALASLLQDPIVGAALYKLTQGSDSVQA
jgi:hypothetical protein